MIEGPIAAAPNWGEFIQWAFYSIITGCAIVGTTTLLSLKETVAQVLEKLTWHEREITRLEGRIDRLDQ